jgi:hypothetical protein
MHRMRKLLCLALLAACGTDVPTAPDASEPVSTSDGGASSSDGAQALGDCQAAAEHADLPWIQEHVLTPSCANGMCHGGAEPKVDLSLVASVARAQLVGHDSSTQPGWIRVVPGDPAHSYLLVALGRGEGPMPRDGFMPLGPQGPLCQEKIDAIERWITAGAN